MKRYCIISILLVFCLVLASGCTGSKSKNIGTTTITQTPIVTPTSEQTSLQLSAEEWNKKGMRFHGEHKYSEAINAYDEAIKIKPKFITAWSNKGRALYDLGRYDEAIVVYDHAIIIDPTDSLLLNKKALVLEAQGKKSEADKLNEKAYEMDMEQLR